MQDVQNVSSWRQLAVGGAFRHEQDAARADAAAVRDAMDKSSQIRRQLSLHRRHVTTGPAAAAARRRRPNSSPGPTRLTRLITDAVAPPELPAALPPRDAWATPDGEARAAVAPAVRAASHQTARLHRALGIAKDIQGSAAKGVKGGGSTSLCKGAHLAASPHGSGEMPICGDMTISSISPPRCQHRQMTAGPHGHKVAVLTAAHAAGHCSRTADPYTRLLRATILSYYLELLSLAWEVRTPRRKEPELLSLAL